MSTLGIDGLISGFNTTELIESLLDRYARGPIEQIEERITTETEKLAGIQTVNANLLSLEITTGSIGTASLFNGKEAKSSNESILSVSANSAAEVGSYSFRVDNLAKAEQVSSDLFVSTSDELGLSGKFILNGKTVSLTDTDTLSTLAAKINAANAGVKANTIQIAPNQNKLVINAKSTGVNKIEMREVGNANILSSLGLTVSDSRYDYTVNADTTGAISSAFEDTVTFSFIDKNFTVTDAGGQNTLTVNLNANTDGNADGALTLQEIADKINSTSTGASANISASVATEQDGKKRLVISSETGIPTRFEDSDNVLFELGVVSGVQSAGLTSTTSSVGDLMNLGSTITSTIQIQDGDGSNTISVDIDLDSDSLDDIVEKINDAAAAETGSDVSARVITVSGVSRLEITSASGLSTAAGDSIFTDSNNVLKTLGLLDDSFKNYDQQGENSQFSYNGVAVNRESNIVSDLIDGVTLSLNEESSSYATVSITEDYSNVAETVDSFITAYNSLANMIAEYTAFDPEEGTKGVLFGDSTIRDLSSSLAAGISSLIPNMPGAKVSDLNDGTGIDLGSIKITNRLGASATFDLTGAETVQDILDAINTNKDIKVTASVNSAGTGFNLTDNSGGTGQFKVEEVNGATTANDLGLLYSIYSNNINGASIYDGGSTSLASIGISLNSDGTLSFDSTKLQSALNQDPDLVKNLLTAANVGFAKSFGAIVKRFSAYGTGLMDARTESIQDRIDMYNDQIERYNDRAEAMEITLRKQFTALESTLSESQQLSQYLTQQLGGSSS
ncbi:MAG: flagellar filament capping protein FliD [Candidatus Omnitrophota bacterium]